MIPQRTVYYTDEHTDEFSTAQIKAIPIDEHYRYGRMTAMFRLIRFLYYRVFAMPIAWTYLKLKWHHKIVGRKEVFRQLGRFDTFFCRSAPKKHSTTNGSNGAVFLYANHTQPIADALIPTFVALPRGVFVIVHANNVSIPGLRQSTKYLGALPLPDNGAAARGFTAALDDRVKSGAAICIYPEAHIWPWCTWIRDFPDVSFRYPVQYDAPVVCFTNTYQRRGKSENSRKVNMVTYVDGPFFPDKSLPPKERRRALRNAVHHAMTERAKMSNAVIVRYVPKAEVSADGGDGAITVGSPSEPEPAESGGYR